MCDTPIGTTRWFTGQDWNGLKKLMYSGGRGGIVTEVRSIETENCSLVTKQFRFYRQIFLILRFS